MAKPHNRQELVDYCLRKLGAPVIKINVDDDQLDDRVDEALKYYWDYHFDGSERVFYKHAVTQEDIDNRYITLPENIIGAVNVYTSTSIAGSYGMFDVRYQMALNDMYGLANQSLVPYYVTQMQIALYEQLLSGMTQLRYNRNTNKLYLDVNWSHFNLGGWIVLEAYSVVDPAIYPDVYSDRWLLKYLTALIKRQWGANMSKYNGVQLIGGMTFNGQQILNSAEEEIEKLEGEMISSYSLPTSFLIG
jgi:hypothetical protein